MSLPPKRVQHLKLPRPQLAAQQITRGMTREEVEAVLGPPSWLYEDYNTSSGPAHDKYDIELRYRLRHDPDAGYHCPYLGVVFPWHEHGRRVSSVYIQTEWDEDPIQVDIE